jgi:hypothetical protein
MNNKEYAHMFVEAIIKLANNSNNLDNLESYLSQHFDIWITSYADTPENITSEMCDFANMEI